VRVRSGVVGTTTFLSGSEYFWGYVTKTGAFKPLPKSVQRPLQRAVERTEAVIERTEAVVKRTEEAVKIPLQKAVQRTEEVVKAPFQKAVQRTKERLKK
jgi:TRAP-type C4-dicarboxylate transport system substrate-binding protein